MSLSNTMASGVSGLLANSTAVERISYNIANADTAGYRRSFAQMVTSGAVAAGASSTGVMTNIAHANNDNGSFQSTSISSNLSIGGNGFFVVNRNISPNSSSPNVMTRVGSFEPDENGFLRNAAGYYLLGFEYDSSGSLGAVDRSSFEDLEPINISTRTISGSETASITLSGNLPSQETGLATPGDPFVSSLEYYTPLGEAKRLTFSWQPSATANEWEVTVSDADMDYGSVTMSFHDSGLLAGSPATYGGGTSLATAPAAFSFDAATGVMELTIDNGATPQVIEISLGEPDSYDGLSQFAGDFTPLDADVDGAQSGALTRVEFDEFGDVWGIFDNGTRQSLYSIPLGTVSNPNGLATSDNSVFSLSADSGDLYLARAGTGDAGVINGGGVESSNVDIAAELTNLIQRQRAYSSNAKIITTADEMLDETLRLKR